MWSILGYEKGREIHGWINAWNVQQRNGSSWAVMHRKIIRTTVRIKI